MVARVQSADRKLAPPMEETAPVGSLLVEVKVDTANRGDLGNIGGPPVFPKP